MADRPVTQSQKDSDGDITALCTPEEYWSPRLKLDAIQDIESGDHTYYVPWNSGRTEIRVVRDPKVQDGKYLRTDRDDTDRNNLDDLADC